MDEEQSVITEPEVTEPASSEVIITDAEAIAEKLMGRMKKGREVLLACDKGLMDSLKVNGKSLRDWGKELRVTLPEDPDDIKGLERAQNEISNKYQIAEYICAIFEMQSNAVLHCHEAEFAERYVAEMEAHKDGKPLAAEKLRQLVLVNSGVDATLSATQAAGLIAEFFKKLSKSLEEARKGIENRGRFLALRAKLS
jgi:hypothetical protein